MTAFDPKRTFVLTTSGPPFLQVRYPTRRVGTQTPADIKEYTAVEKLEWKNTGKTRMSSNPKQRIGIYIAHDHHRERSTNHGLLRKA